MPAKQASSHAPTQTFLDALADARWTVRAYPGSSRREGCVLAVSPDESTIFRVTMSLTDTDRIMDVFEQYDDDHGEVSVSLFRATRMVRTLQ